VGAEFVLWRPQVRQKIAIAFGTGYGIVGEHNSAVTKMGLHQLERRKCKGRPN